MTTGLQEIVTPILRQWTVQQNIKEQASRKEFFLSRGPPKSEPCSRTAVNPSAPPPNPIIPPIIATTLYWPFWFPALTHKLGISFIFYSKPPTGSLPNPPPLPFTSYVTLTRLSHCSPHRIPALDKSRQEQWHPYVDTPECADVLRQPKCYSCYCRFSDWEICWLRPVACPIWTAAGPIWLSNLGEKAATRQSSNKTSKCTWPCFIYCKLIRSGLIKKLIITYHPKPKKSHSFHYYKLNFIGRREGEYGYAVHSCSSYKR